MLLDIGVLLSAYVGVRYFEGRKKKQALFLRKITKKQSALAKKEISDEKQLAQQKEQLYDKQLKIGTINLGISVIRQYFYPPIAPLYLALLSYTTYHMFKGAEKSLRNKQVDSNVFSSLFTLAGIGMNQYFALTLGNWIYVLGCKIVAKIQNDSHDSIKDIFKQLPSKIWVLKEGVELEVAVENLQIGDIVIISAGGVIPIDGVITQGMAIIDQQALTGESQPAEKEIGDVVLASTIVVSGSIQIQVEKNGYETTFYKINQLLNHTANFKTQIQLHSEDLANQVALPFICISAVTAVILGPSAGLVMMSSNFGNRFRVLAPLGTLNYLKQSAHKGILIKDGRSIEQLNKVDTVLFDKTGTLTKEVPEVSRVLLFAEYSHDELLTYAAAAERKLTHPIAKAIVQKAYQQNLKLPDIDDSKYQIGYGITVHIHSKIINVGSRRFMLTQGFDIPTTVEDDIHASYNEGNSLVFIAIEQQVVGAVELQATVRPEVKSIVKALRQRGIKHIAIVSGDHKAPTQKLTKALDMDSYFYDVLPSDKSNIVEQLQAEGKIVCFIGDGINDTIAMKKANVSISLTGASTIAIDVAEVILMDGTLNNLIEVFDISKDLNQHLKNSFRITLVPTAISMTGALLFNIGFMTAFTIKNIIFLVSIGHATSPKISQD